MKKPLTLTEQAIRQLTDMALMMHYAEFRKRLDRLHRRLIGEMEAVKIEIEVERVDEMRKITYKIRGQFITNQTTNTEKEKKGYLVILPDYPGLRLAAYKMTFEHNSNVQWNITDLRTGYRFLLGGINETLKSCKNRCLERINKYGLVAILQMQDEVLKKYNRVEAN